LPRPETATDKPPSGAPASGAPAAEPVEVEVKFGVARPELIVKLIEHPDPARLAGFEPVAEPHLDVITDRYLDTGVAEGRLFLSGMRARLREARGGVTLTVKRRGTLAGAVTTRAELEGPATSALEPDAWPASAARDLLLAATAGARLVEIAALRQHRLVRNVRRGETLVELSLDELDALEQGQPVDHRVELEAELKAGPAGPLDDLAAALATIDGVGPPAGSKLDFALRGARPILPREPVIPPES
jgi:inorganic triphosphatase YgiF